MNPQGDPLLLVTVGTDHHPFDRLVRWVDGWLATPGGCAVGLRCLMQTGTAAPPTGSAAGWQDYLEFEVLQAAMRDTAAVVCHGGPGTILGARHMGAVPIVVPRRRRLGEHVDDHKVAFSRRLAAARQWARRTLALNRRERRAYMALAVSIGSVPAGAVVRLAHAAGKGS